MSRYTSSMGAWSSLTHLKPHPAPSPPFTYSWHTRTVHGVALAPSARVVDSQKDRAGSVQVRLFGRRARRPHISTQELLLRSRDARAWGKRQNVQPAPEAKQQWPVHSVGTGPEGLSGGCPTCSSNPAHLPTLVLRGMPYLWNPRVSARVSAAAIILRRPPLFHC